MAFTCLRQARALHSHLLSTLPFHLHSPIFHPQLLAAVPSHLPIQPVLRPTQTTLGTSFPITSRGAMSTKSTVRGHCRVQRVTASSYAPPHLCATSAPQKLVKNAVNGRQRCVLSPLPSTSHGCLQPPKCTGTRPSCARCASRDYLCEYASEVIPESANYTKARRSRREIRELVHKDSSIPSPPNHCIKAEMPEFLPLHYPDHASPCWEGSTPSDDCSMEEPWQFHGGILPGATNHSLAGRPSIPAPHPVRHTHPQPLMAPLPTHGGAQAAGLHGQIQLPMLPHFAMPSQRLVEHEAYLQPQVKYEQSTALGPHSYDSLVTSCFMHPDGS